MQTNEIKFLVALIASEESPAYEIADEFEKREADQRAVLMCISDLADQGIIAFYRNDGDSCTDLDLPEVVKLRWPDLRQKDLCIFMPDQGWEIWKTESWGLTKEQADELMFGSAGVGRFPASNGISSLLGKLLRRR